MSPSRAWRRRRAVSDYLRKRAAAHADRQGDIRWLRKKGKTPTALALAAKLEACQPNQRCRSGACRVCSTKAQGYLAQSIRRLVGHDRIGVGLLTIIPRASITAVGALAERDHANHERRLKRALQEAEIEWAVGATDFTLNEHRQHHYQPHWCPHLHALIRVKDFADVKRRLKHFFDADKAIKRPVRFDPWDGHMAALLYLGETSYQRRLGHLKTVNNRPVADTSKAELRSAERLELMLHYDKLSIQQRTFCFGLQIRQQRYSWGLQIKVRGMPKVMERHLFSHGNSEIQQ